jgi:hypothetical protein
LGQGRENAKVFLAENSALTFELENLIRQKAGLPTLAEVEDLEAAAI